MNLNTLSVLLETKHRTHVIGDQHADGPDGISGPSLPNFEEGLE